MPKTYILILLILVSTSAGAQNKFKVSSPKLSFENNILSIEYNITNCSVNDIFFIDIEIKDSKGNIINASSLTGDIGKNISCGRAKKIYWNLADDNFLLNDEIEVEMVAERIFVQTPSSSIPVQGNKTLTRGSVMASSILVPGLGQKKASGKSAHLLMSGLFYGTAGASAYFYSDYKKKYDLYLVETNQAESDRLFEQSEQAYNKARIFMYQAIGFWTVNMIWSAVIPIKDPDAVALIVTPNEMGGLEFGASITF